MKKLSMALLAAGLLAMPACSRQNRGAQESQPSGMGTAPSQQPSDQSGSQALPGQPSEQSQPGQAQPGQAQPGQAQPGQNP